jgi:hypothetical protein
MMTEPNGFQAALLAAIVLYFSILAVAFLYGTAGGFLNAVAVHVAERRLATRKTPPAKLSDVDAAALMAGSTKPWDVETLPPLPLFGPGEGINEIRRKIIRGMALPPHLVGNTTAGLPPPGSLSRWPVVAGCPCLRCTAARLAGYGGGIPETINCRCALTPSPAIRGEPVFGRKPAPKPVPTTEPVVAVLPDGREIFGRAPIGAAQIAVAGLGGAGLILDRTTEAVPYENGLAVVYRTT